MRLGGFARFGHIRFGGREARPKTFYRALKQNMGDAFDYSLGGHTEATVFATAMCAAGAAAALERGANQRRGATATDQIPSLERDYEVVPGEQDTLNDRRAALASKEMAPNGPSQRSVERALGLLLGADLVAYVPASTPSARTPLGIDAGPGSFPRDDAPLKFLRLLQPVAIVGVPFTFAYDGDALLVRGDKVVVQIENRANAELITIASATSSHATATFTRAHDPLSSLRVGPTPYWESMQRSALVIVSSTAARNPVTRSKIHARMREMVRGTMIWSIVEATGSHVAGPFLLGVSPLGSTPFGTVTY